MMRVGTVLAVCVAAAVGERCDDTCEFAKNGVCNDATATYSDDIVSRGGEDDLFDFLSACAPGTDCTDCSSEMIIEDITAGVVVCDDTCWFANDGFCDDGRFGLTAFCQLGTDCGDCGPVINFNDDVADIADYYYYGDYYDDLASSYSYDYYDYYAPVQDGYDYYYGYYYDDRVGRVDEGSTTTTIIEWPATDDEYADDAPFVAAAGDDAARAVARRENAAMVAVQEPLQPTIDIEIIVEEDDEVEIVVNDDAFARPSLGPAVLVGVFLLGLAGGLAGYATGVACRAACTPRTGAADSWRRAIKRQRGSSRQAALATPLLV